MESQPLFKRRTFCALKLTYLLLLFPWEILHPIYKKGNVAVKVMLHGTVFNAILLHKKSIRMKAGFHSG